MNILTLSLGLTGLVLGASCTTIREMPEQPSPEGVVRVPLVLEGGMAWVDARIGGKPVRLLLDTGGFDAVALTPEVLAGLDVTWTGRSKSTYSAMGETARAREYALPEFELGGVVFRDAKGYEDLLLGTRQAVGRSGYLGLGILRRFRLVIDFAARRLVLIWPDAPTPAEYDVENWPAVEFAASSDGIVGRAKVDGVERLLVWDTGASHCVLKTGLEGANPVRLEGGHPFITAASFEVRGRELGATDFALLPFKQPRADGFVGYPFFVKHAVYVDFTNRIFAIRP